MNGLAASRRNRGLPGSVLNIGVIYGLGFLHRERGELYAGLEREGYPPISERDVHHMFLEAIVAGRPSCSSGPKVTTDKQHSQVYDIVTGLKRFRFGSPDPLYWQQDARFSHFSVVDDTSDTLINNTGNSGCNQDVKERLEQAETVDAATETLLAPFSSFLEDLLQLPKGSVRSDHSLTELGVDSLVAVSIRSWILRTSGEDIAVLKILGSTSIAKRELLPLLPRIVFSTELLADLRASNSLRQYRRDGHLVQNGSWLQTSRDRSTAGTRPSSDGAEVHRHRRSARHSNHDPV